MILRSWKTLLFMAFVWGPAALQAQTWVATPVSSDWSATANWDNATVPNGLSDVATFGSSSVVPVILTEDVDVASIYFNSGAPSYTLDTDAYYLTFYDKGIVNTSGASQTLLNNLFLTFYNSSTADDVVLINNHGTNFYDSSTAGTASIDNEYSMGFGNTATAGSANILNNSSLSFNDSSSAGSATIVNNSYLAFNGDSTAASATLFNNAFLGLYGNATLGSAAVSNSGTGSLYFYNDSSAGSAGIVNDYAVVFGDSSSAGGASIVNPGDLRFNDSSDAGTAAIHNTGTLAFYNDSTASSAAVTNDSIMTFSDDSTAGSAGILNNATLSFGDDSTAGDASITVTGSSASLVFTGNATAGDANILDQKTLTFMGSSTAGNAVVTVTSGSVAAFQAGAAGGTAQFVLSSGILNIESSTSGVTVGSIEGTGTVFLGGKALAVGSNDLSTTLTGTLDDGVNVGSFTKIGTGTLTLSGANTYDGGTTVAAGALRITGTGTLGTGTVQVVGTLDLSGHTGNLDLGALSGSGQVSLGGNQLTVGGNDASTTFTGGLEDGGFAGGTGAVLVKTGSGTLALNGANGFSGGTELEEGSLLVGNASALGSGEVDVNGGTLAFLGATPLDLQLGDDYIQQSAGALRMGIGDPLGSGSDHLQIAGTADLAGSLAVTAYGAYQPVVGDMVTVLTATGGVSGRFDDWTNPVGIRWYPIYGSNDVSLWAIHPSFEALGATANQRSLGAWLDASYQDPTLEGLVLQEGAQSTGVLRDDFDRLSPEELASLYRPLFSQADSHAGLVVDHLSNWREGAPGSAGRSGNLSLPLAGGFSGYQEGLNPRGAGGPDAVHVHVAGIGSFGSVAADAQAAGFDFDTKGASAGIEMGLGPDLLGGLLLSYGKATVTGSAQVEGQGGSAGLYVGGDHQGFHWEAFAEGGIQDLTLKRATFGGTAQGKTQAFQMTGMAAFGYDLRSKEGSFGPFGRVLYSRVDLGAFQETGSASPLDFPAQGQGDLTTQAGIQAQGNFPSKGWSLVPKVSAAWEHVLEGNQEALTAGWPGVGGTFQAQGPDQGTGGLALSAAVAAEFNGGWSFFLRYEGRLAFTRLDAQSFGGGVQVGL